MMRLQQITLRVSLALIATLLLGLFVLSTPIFAEHRLIDVGIYYGKLSPSWTELTTEDSFVLRIDKEPAGDIGSTKAIGLDGTESSFYHLRDGEMPVDSVLMQPAAGYYVVVERLEEPSIELYEERSQYYASLGIETILGYDYSVFLGQYGFETYDDALAYIEQIGVGEEIVDASTCFSVKSIASGNQIAIISAENRDCTIISDKIRMYSASSSAAVHYRGGFRYTLDTRGRLGLINRVELEDYLCGVVPVEMLPDAPLQALKAQAVAARNYATYPSGKYSNYGFDVDDSTGSQVYRGYDSERENSTQAVRSTAGEYLMYDDELIVTYFSASSGGYMDSIKGIWGGKDKPYFYAKADPYSLEYTWYRDLSYSLLLDIVDTLGGYVGNPVGLEITERTEGGRAKIVTILGDQGRQEIAADRFRGLSGTLKSTLITFDYNFSENPYDEDVLNQYSESEENSSEESSKNTEQSEEEEDEETSDDDDGVEYVLISEINGRAISENPPTLTFMDIEKAEKNDKDDKDDKDDGEDDKKKGDDLSKYVIGFPEYEVAYFDGGGIRVYGHGWGHGLGLSQLGAIEMAKQGYDYEEILAFYYNSNKLIEQ